MNKHKSPPFLVFVGGSIPVGIILASYYGLSETFTVIFVIFVGLVFCSWAFWGRANSRANGNEWWQDDQCSGWRGY